jgi:hypothetical protein
MEIPDTSISPFFYLQRIGLRKKKKNPEELTSATSYARIKK